MAIDLLVSEKHNAVCVCNVLRVLGDAVGARVKARTLVQPGGELGVVPTRIVVEHDLDGCGPHVLLCRDGGFGRDGGERYRGRGRLLLLLGLRINLAGLLPLVALLDPLQCRLVGAGGLPVVLVIRHDLVHDFGHAFRSKLQRPAFFEQYGESALRTRADLVKLALVHETNVEVALLHEEVDPESKGNVLEFEHRESVIHGLLDDSLGDCGRDHVSRTGHIQGQGFIGKFLLG
mmetsp:Transcript_37852/g.58636  ORF Transcript_37852/g.58636 Transcript_37852/m.58636 type:complete len:233 (-) Transcript_37852:472-1170(-)